MLEECGGVAKLATTDCLFTLQASEPVLHPKSWRHTMNRRSFLVSFPIIGSLRFGTKKTAPVPLHTLNKGDGFAYAGLTYLVVSPWKWLDSWIVKVTCVETLTDHLWTNDIMVIPVKLQIVRLP